MKVLHYSGGLDSLACLELLKDEPDLTVITASTDGGYPDREQYFKKVEAHYHQLPFVYVYKDRNLEKHGQPVDVLPIKWSEVGAMVHNGPVRYQSVFDCCNRGIWTPVHEASVKLGATTIYRGQKAADPLKAPIKDGHVEAGITYRFPIEGWSRKEVIEFVHERVPELIPAYYQREQTSRDCWDCTAYLHENHDRIRYLPYEERLHVIKILDQWRKDVNDETRW